MAAPAPGISNIRLSVDQICIDFMGRRDGILRALTTDEYKLLKQCNPVSEIADKEKLCLYGLPDGTWQVCPPPDQLSTNIPPPMPVPPFGINFVGEKKDWLAKVARRGDEWLESVAIYHADRSRLSLVSRDKLFDCINGSPKLGEIMTAMATKQPGEDREARCWDCGSGADSKPWILCSACQRGFHQRCIQQDICTVCSDKHYRAQF